MNNYLKIHLFIYIFFLCLILSCVTQKELKNADINYDPANFVRDGIQYCKDKGTFGGRWHDFYERGLSCMEGEFYSEALNSFDKALNKRSDRLEDQRMARKYGTRFIDYFPHREKGIIHYLMGKFDLAKMELERSLAHEYSDKAQRYLDKVRSQIMKINNEKLIVPDLVITFNGVYPVNGSYQTNDKTVLIEGIASSTQYISEIRMNHEKVFFQKTDTNVHFKRNLSLQQGTHQIRIKARSLSGAEKIETVTVHIDREGPRIVLTSFDKNGQIAGYVHDDSGLLSLSLDQKAIPIHQKNHVEFSFAMQINNKESKLVATDQLGNSSMLIIDQMLLKAFTQFLISQNDNTALDSEMPLSAQVHQKNKPIIYLYGWKDISNVYTDAVKLEGVVISKNQLKSLYINDKIVDGKSEKIFSFCETILLKKDKNKIHITAIDHNMNTVEKSLMITREVPEMNKIVHRCTLHMMPININSLYEQERSLWARLISFRQAIFNSKEMIQDPLANNFQEYLMNEFIEHQRFRLVIKGDPSSVFNADFLIQGYIVKTRLGVEVVIHFVSAQTREVLCVKDAYIENQDLQLLAERITHIIHQEFPMVKGKVSQIFEQGVHVVADDDGLVKMKWPVLFFRIKETVRNPVTGAFLGNKFSLVGKGIVLEVQKDQFVVSSDKWNEVLLNDCVVTK